MRAHKASTIAIAILLFLSGSVSARAQLDPNADPGLIILDAADTVRIETPSTNGGLNGFLNAVPARMAVEYANTVRELALEGPPAPFAVSLSSTAARISMEYANSARTVALSSAPPALESLLNAVAARLQIENANHNREFVTSFPKALLNDRQAPTVTSFTSDSLKIRWQTNEFVTSLIRIGLKSGAYTQDVNDPSFRIEHELLLPREVVEAVAAAEAAGVPDAADATYYVRIISTDLSGNQGTSSEYTAKGVLRVYLPAVER